MMTQSSFFSRSASRFASTVSILGLFALVGLLPQTFSSANALEVRADLLGYHPSGPKQAIIEDLPADWNEKNYKVVVFDPIFRAPLSSRPGKIFYEAKLAQTFGSTEGTSVGPGMKKVLYDFSEFNKTGDFELRIIGPNKEFVAKPLPIKISEFLYWDTMKAALRSFYLHRSGFDLFDAVTKTERPAAHVADAMVEQPNGLKPIHHRAAGGWYQGYHYGKSVSTTSLSIAKLLTLYQWSPKAFEYLDLQYAKNEPNDKLPSILHEMKIGLEWLMAMQDDDGGVFSEVKPVKALMDYENVPRPHEETDARYLGPITVEATAQAAASLAIAARIYKPEDLGYAIKSLRAAEKAWRYLEKQPVKNMREELPLRIWAATELYISTEKPEYHKYVLKNTVVGTKAYVPFELITPDSPELIGWVNYMDSTKIAKDPTLSKAIWERLTTMAQSVMNAIKADPYGTGFNEYELGSNYQLMERLSILLYVVKLSNTERTPEALMSNPYLAMATKGIHYVFGLNPLGKVFITAANGTLPNSVNQPCHPIFKALGTNAPGRLIPGMLVIGPNTSPIDNITPVGMGASSYVDKEDACSSNRTSILGNARLAFVLGAMNALFNPQAQEDADPVYSRLDKNGGGAKRYPTFDGAPVPGVN